MTQVLLKVMINTVIVMNYIDRFIIHIIVL